MKTRKKKKRKYSAINWEYYFKGKYSQSKRANEPDIETETDRKTKRLIREIDRFKAVEF